MIRASWLTLAACAPLAGGCMPPKTLNAPYQPWCAPSKRATLKLDRDLMSDAALAYWVDASGNRHDRHTFAPRLADYLRTCGATKDWPHFGGEVLAPYELTIVSITPTVVLMTPVDFGPVDDKAVPTIRSQEHRRSVGHSPKFLNAFVASTQCEHAAGMKWFSDEMNRPPTPLAFGADGAATIPLPDGELSVFRYGHRCEVLARK